MFVCAGPPVLPGLAAGNNVRALCRVLSETCDPIPTKPVAYHPPASSRMLAVIGTDRYRSRMILEDHPGDIIRKARAMSGVSAATAAAAAGIPETELSALEETGQAGKRPDFTAMANLIGLNPAKLEA